MTLPLEGGRLLARGFVPYQVWAVGGILFWEGGWWGMWSGGKSAALNASLGAAGWTGAWHAGAGGWQVRWPFCHHPDASKHGWQLLRPPWYSSCLLLAAPGEPTKAGWQGWLAGWLVAGCWAAAARMKGESELFSRCFCPQALAGLEGTITTALLTPDMQQASKRAQRRLRNPPPASPAP